MVAGGVGRRIIPPQSDHHHPNHPAGRALCGAPALRRGGVGQGKQAGRFLRWRTILLTGSIPWPLTFLARCWIWAAVWPGRPGTFWRRTGRRWRRRPSGTTGGSGSGWSSIRTTCLCWGIAAIGKPAAAPLSTACGCMAWLLTTPKSPPLWRCTMRCAPTTMPSAACAGWATAGGSGWWRCPTGSRRIWNGWRSRTSASPLTM